MKMVVMMICIILHREPYWARSSPTSQPWRRCCKPYKHFWVFQKLYLPVKFCFYVVLIFANVCHNAHRAVEIIVYLVMISEITPANRNRLERNSTGRRRLRWHAPTQTSANWRRKKTLFAKFFCQQNNASFHPWISLYVGCRYSVGSLDVNFILDSLVSLMVCSHRRHERDQMFCLVCSWVTPPTRTRQDNFVSSASAVWTSHNGDVAPIVTSGDVDLLLWP